MQEDAGYDGSLAIIDSRPLLYGQWGEVPSYSLDPLAASPSDSQIKESEDHAAGLLLSAKSLFARCLTVRDCVAFGLNCR
jgi:hypothetical protein